VPASRAFWFGPARQELFAFYHAPAADSVGLGIVLCNPFGYEAMCTHRAYRHLAERLAAHGFPVLRFDYHGTGNSSGNDMDPARWQAWLGSVRAAIDELERRSGCTRVGLVGLRLGANLALLAAETRCDVAAVALWAPFYTGKAFLREELAVHRMRALSTRVERMPDSIGGDTEALGFTLTQETVTALEAHAVTALNRAPAPAALVLTRETPYQEQRVASRLGELGMQVTCEAAEGYARMINDNQPPDEVWARIIRYFEAHTRAAGAAIHFRADPPAQPPLRTLTPVWDTTTAHAPVREVATQFGPGQRLFGVITHGRVQPGVEPPPAVLLLSGGFNHHVGQNRMYTRWARAWAHSGITSLRFDLAGFGDSRVRDGSCEGQLHALDSVADVRAAMDHLAALCGSRRFAIVGLCSGAFMAFYSALADSRVVCLALLNWTHFYPIQSQPSVAQPRDRQYRSLHFYLSALTRRSTWRKLMRGRIDVRGIGRTFVARSFARARTQFIAGLPAWLAGVLAPTPLARDLRSLAARGVRTLVVYNGDDPALDQLHEQWGPEARRLRAERLLRLEILDGTDHIFTPAWSQARLAALLTEYLSDQLDGSARHGRAGDVHAGHDPS
jgi:alpha-beta hydrolase superfamily lysophospholipase